MNDLVRLMEKVDTPGTFSVSGTLTSIFPGLTVKGFGLVSLPLCEPQAKALIELSKQAPFGRGEATIVDTEVRKVWQISRDDFELTNPQWEETLQIIIHEKIGKPLGLHGCEIKSEPYKLLMYEKGSFFKVHRDTEKIPNMFATLVINLPSEHEGGELIVSHSGHQQNYTFANQDLFHSYFLAFYADCYHEVKPITSGYRICLVYNLAIANRKKQPLLSQSLNNIRDVKDFIHKWTKKNQNNPILCYLLEHSYSEKNLSFSNLKNGDSSKATVLLNAAEQNNCKAFLCLVTYCRTSYGESIYYGRYSYRNDELTEAEFDEYDVEKEEIYAHCFITAKGERLLVENLYLEEDELITKVPLLDGPGRDIFISEATGNEGATKELWYHRGAVIIWPKDRDLDMVTKMDVNYGIHYLKNFLKEQNISKKKDREKVIQLADYILDHRSPYSSEDISSELIVIGHIPLLKKYIHQKISVCYDMSIMDTQTFIQIFDQFGWHAFEKDVSNYLIGKRNILQWINSLLRNNGSLSTESKNVVTRWFESVWEVSLKNQLTTEKLSTALQIISILNIKDVANILLEFLSQYNQPSFLTEIYGPSVLKAVKELKDRNYDREILRRFVENVQQRVETDYSSPPEKPKDWFREGSLNCQCEFCSQVNQFLPNPDQPEISFEKTLKRNLTHIASEIEKSQVELDINIIKTPPKFHGNCRKNQSRFDKKMNLYKQATNIMKNLQAEPI